MRGWAETWARTPHVNWPMEMLKENSKGVEEGNGRGAGSKWEEEKARRRHRRGTITSGAEEGARQIGVGAGGGEGGGC